MHIDTDSGNRLCAAVQRSVTNWASHHAVLQSGGLEVKWRGRIASALERWLKREKDTSLVVPEYRRRGNLIDFALVTPESVAEPRLKVTTLIEVKANYATQSKGRQNKRSVGEIGRRVRNGIRQARGYRKKANAESAYVLYIVVDPHCKRRPDTPRDHGYSYYRQTHAQRDTSSPDAMSKAKDAIARAARKRRSRIVGRADSRSFHVSLLRT